MKPNPISCCSALLNPLYHMVEATQTHHPLAYRLLRLIAYLLAGGILAQAFSCGLIYFLIYDSQAAGMLAHMMIQHLSYFFLGGIFVIISVSNILIKRGVSHLRVIRFPSLTVFLAIATTSFLLIPRMDYLRETALIDGMPVLLSPFANYFAILNAITLLLLTTQIIFSAIIAWRLSDTQLTQVASN
ncbi:DUF4149 domain-containing protein [Polynucleobacter sp. MWH-Berg-3C6]|nr:DUF4149 domain-containing protein [Polynucleobacter sp. MWH-Berg-3C6]